MSEFQNRISAQRKIIQLVNARFKLKYELFGLAYKAIERWIFDNRLDKDSKLVNLVILCGDKLNFLANKSQEQITEEYKSTEQEIEDIYTKLETLGDCI